MLPSLQPRNGRAVIVHDPVMLPGGHSKLHATLAGQRCCVTSVDKQDSSGRKQLPSAELLCNTPVSAGYFHPVGRHPTASNRGQDNAGYNTSRTTTQPAHACLLPSGPNMVDLSAKRCMQAGSCITLYRKDACQPEHPWIGRSCLHAATLVQVY